MGFGVRVFIGTSRFGDCGFASGLRDLTSTDRDLNMLPKTAQFRVEGPFDADETAIVGQAKVEKRIFIDR